MINATILTEGSKEKGMGHIIRCKSIADALFKKQIKPTFLLNGTEDAKSLLEDYEVKIIDWIDKIDEIGKQDIIIVDS